MEMNKLSEKQRISAEIISDNLLQEVVIPFNNSYYSYDVEDYLAFDGRFKGKIDWMLDNRKNKTRSISFSVFNFKRVELGDLNGLQFVHVLAAICGDKNLIKTGNCIVISIDKHEEVALLVYGDNWYELTTTPRNAEDRRYFRKLFDETMCKKHAEKFPEEYSEDALDSIRKPFPNILLRFFGTPVMEVDELYRHVCFGLVSEIAKLQTDSPAHKAKRSVPVAALIWLAVFNGLSQKLQSLFGDHNLPRDKRSLSQRKSDRTEVAHSIIAEALPVSEDGHYDEEKLTNSIRDMRNMYGITTEQTQ